MSRLLFRPLGGSGSDSLTDPFTGVGVEDESEPLRPARTMISVGANAWYIKIPNSKASDYAEEDKTVEERKRRRTLICPSDAANIAPVFVAEKPSKKIVVML